MASKVLVPVDDYLNTAYEHDPEYVRGEIVERGMPTKKHSRLQVRLVRFFETLEANHGAYTLTEQRNRLASDLYRIPDVAVYSSEPAEEIPEHPPLVAVEIVSPDDRHSALIVKCEEYRKWGVPHIWVADPQTRKLSVYRNNGLQDVPEFTLAQFAFTLTPAQLFD